MSSIIRTMIETGRRYPWALSTLLIVVLWAVAAEFNWVGKTLIASPREVVQALGDGFESNASKQAKVHVHALHTIGRAIQGWAIALTVGVVFGTALGVTGLAFRASEPAIEFVRAIPPVLALPLFLVAFNYGESAYLWTIVFGCAPIAILAVSRGTHLVSKDRLEILQVHNVSRTIRYFAVCMEILPSVFLAARITLSFAIIIVVVTEMVFTPRNGWAIGALARDAEIDFNTPRFYACVIVIGTVGFLGNIGIKRIEGWFGIRSTNGSDEA